MSTDAPQLGPVSPLFIVREVTRSYEFYMKRLGFELRYLNTPNEPFFAIVGRGAAQLMLKCVEESVEPLPNPVRHPWASWDAFVHAPDPEALAAELQERGASFHAPLGDHDGGLRGFEIDDLDGYRLFFGRPFETPGAQSAGTR